MNGVGVGNCSGSIVGALVSIADRALFGSLEGPSVGDLVGVGDGELEGTFVGAWLVSFSGLCIGD